MPITNHRVANDCLLSPPEEFDWAGTGPKNLKRSETSIPYFKELVEQREKEEKKNRIRKDIEMKRQAKFEADGHKYEE